MQAFLQRILNGGGRIDREYGLGRRRTDLLIQWPLVETQGFQGPVQWAVIELKLRHKSLAALTIWIGSVLRRAIWSSSTAPRRPPGKRSALSDKSRMETTGSGCGGCEFGFARWQWFGPLAGTDMPETGRVFLLSTRAPVWIGWVIICRRRYSWSAVVSFR